MSRVVRVGLLGLGNVGTGVVKILASHGEAIEARLGARLEIARVAVRDPSRPREVQLEEGVLTGSVEDVLTDPDIDIVAELMGGTDVARDAILGALAEGKQIVTANKALLALHGEEIFSAAAEAGSEVLYEAAVGGGIPIVRTLREALASDEILALSGVLNGTTNFILSEMSETGRSFDDVLAEAQSLGYAEADPSADVDGHDAAQKLSLLASISFGVRIHPDRVHTEGIRQVSARDIAFAKEMGYAVKLLAIAQRHEDGQISLRVHPTFVPERSLLANVGGAFNAVQVHGASLGPSLYFGQGAGSLPTGSAVVADLIDGARNVLADTAGRIPARATREEHLGALDPRPMADLEVAHYLRFNVQDQPGVLGRITSVLGDYGISIAALVQKERRDPSAGPVAVVVTTHEAVESAVVEAVEVIDRLPFVKSPTVRLRIETEPPVIAS